MHNAAEAAPTIIDDSSAHITIELYFNSWWMQVVADCDQLITASLHRLSKIGVLRKSTAHTMPIVDACVNYRHCMGCTETTEMKLIDAYARIKKLGLPVIKTRDAATCLALNTAHASKLLSRLGEAEVLIKISQGLWAFPDRAEALLIPQYLSAPLPSYISLQTALYYHGMISQIPETIYAVSLARTRTYKTPMGVFSLHHVHPDYFYDYEQAGKYGINMATPEKALMDIFYLASAKTKLFVSLPEVELPDTFDIDKAREIISKIPDAKRRVLAEKRLEEILSWG